MWHIPPIFSNEREQGQKQIGVDNLNYFFSEMDITLMIGDLIPTHILIRTAL